MLVNKQNQPSRITLTDHVSKNQKDEAEIMRGFRFKFPLPEQLSQSNLNILSAQAQFQEKEREKTVFLQHHKGEQKGDKRVPDNFYRVDNKASIVNGKLILFESGEKSLKDNGRELMRLLRQNQIGYKEYMLGDKEKFHQRIAQRQKQKEEHLIKQYIDQHINMEKTTKIEIPDYSGKSTCSTTFKSTSLNYTN